MAIYQAGSLLDKSHVGLGNVANVDLGNVTNESKATMFTNATFTGSTNFHSANPGIRQSEGTDGSDYGHFARRMSWTNSSSLIICQWALGAHHCANFILHFAWTDWCCHSGGGGMCTGTAASGYGSPGSFSEYNMHYDSHSFWLSASGNTIRVLCSGGDGSGPGNVFVGCSTNRSDCFSWGS